MATARNQSQNQWVSTNRGIQPKGGLRFDWIPDRVTNRDEALTAVIGGRAFIKSRPGPGGTSVKTVKLPKWAKKIHAAEGAMPSIHGQKIIRASIVENVVGGQKRFEIMNGDDDPCHYVTFTTGLEAVADAFGNKSTANHRLRVMAEQGRLFPFGVVAFDTDALKLLTVVQGDDDDVRLAMSAKSPAPGRGTAEQQGKTQHSGRYIESIDCFETELSSWKFKPKDACLKGMVWGEVRQVRLVDGIMVERTVTDDFIRKLFYRALAVEKQAQRALVAAQKQIIKPDGNSIDPTEVVTADEDREATKAEVADGEVTVVPSLDESAVTEQV